MDPFATLADVESRAGVSYGDVEAAQVEVLLVDVSELIRTHRPSIDTWIATGMMRPGIVKAVACQAVARVLTSVGSGGIGVRSETHPEHSYTLTDAAAAGLNLTEDELSLLSLPSTRGRAFSIKPG
jgi:hypothetical protein